MILAAGDAVVGEDGHTYDRDAVVGEDGRTGTRIAATVVQPGDRCAATEYANLRGFKGERG